MTAKEKAISLVEKYFNSIKKSDWDDLARRTSIECAKIAVNEIIQALPVYDLNPELEYWNEVISELNKM